MILTLEIKEQSPINESELALCFDDEGLGILIGKLQSLMETKDHLHLMTPSWAGDDLTEDKIGGEDYVLLNHLRLVKI